MRLPLIASILLLGPVGTLAASIKLSKDASCGGKKGYTCLNSQWGNCCSKHGWCGSTSAYCGTGCNSAFGTCSKIKPAPSPSSQPISSNARCGPSFGGKICQGSGFGDCCSLHSWCGSTSDYCGATNCQKGFGKCNTESSSSGPIPSTLVTSTRGSDSSSIASSSVELSSSAISALFSSLKSSSSVLPSLPSSAVESLTSSAPLSSSTGLLQSSSASVSLSPSVNSFSSPPIVESFRSSIAQSSSSLVDESISSTTIPSVSSTAVPSVRSTAVPNSSSAVDLSSSSSKIATSSSVQATPVLTSFEIVSSSSIEAISSSFSSKVISSSALSSAAASSYSISIVSPTQTTQPSSSSVVPSSSRVPLSPLPTCGVLGTINKNSVFTSGLSKTQNACRQECLDYNTGGWKCQIYSMPTLYAGCTLLLSNPALPELNGAFIKEDTGNARYWDVTCEGVSTLPFTYPSPVPARGCDAPGVPGRAQLDVPSDYGFSKTPGDCHQECQNYNLNGWKCRAYGFSPSPPLCWLTLGKPAPTLDTVLRRESNSNIMWWETTCAGAAPSWPSIPGTSPWTASRCGMRGMPVPWGTGGFKYDIIRQSSRRDCKTTCERYNLNDDSCKVYGVSPDSQNCYLTVASKAPGYDDAFYPKTDGTLWWFQEGCSEPDTWFRENGLYQG